MSHRSLLGQWGVAWRAGAIEGNWHSSLMAIFMADPVLCLDDYNYNS